MKNWKSEKYSQMEKSDMWYDNLNNKRLWSIFEELEEIPRESGNEEGVRSWLLKWAEEHSIEAVADKVGNVIMYVPATPGYENLPSIALQGHMDMVCVKRDGSSHDFKKDPIEVMTDGKTVYAKDTSLGADNGIAIATALDIFSDPDAKHGPLEGIFTVSEETGLTGAYGIEKELVHSRRLLNLDSEEEGIIYIGCAGGIEVDGKAKAKWTEPEGEAIAIKISGLLGGHSGGEIHKGRANALNLFGRLMNRIPGGFQIAAIDGGSRRNVIPSVLNAVVMVRDTETAISIANHLSEEIANEYCIADPDIKLTLEQAEKPDRALDKNLSAKLADLLFTSPFGVYSMSASLPGVVETSDNLAIVKLNENELSVVWSIRSSIESAKLNMAYRILTLSERFGFSAVISGDYPAWQPDPESEFTKEVAAAYERIEGRKPVITAIHAGLECGIINEKIEGMDSLSIGPNLFDVHSVNEHVEVESAERTASFVKQMLKEIR